jgi:hypothetical protein
MLARTTQVCENNALHMRHASDAEEGARTLTRSARAALHWPMHMRRAVTGAHWNIKRQESPGDAMRSNMRLCTTSRVLCAASSCTCR